MSDYEKLLKKVEQDRTKGQLDRALARLKEALAQNPRSFPLAQEAAGLCFELGRTLEGAGILRSVLKRSPKDRASALERLEREYATAQLPELAEILYDAYLATPDLDRAREVLRGLAAPELQKLHAKLQAKVQAVVQDAPDDAARLAGLLLAEALALSTLQRPADAAAALERVLELDPSQNDSIGRLCKLELREAPDCGEVHLLLARCYLNIDKPDLAEGHLVAAGRSPELRARALGLTESGRDAPVLARARAELFLRGGDHAAAERLLATMLESETDLQALVRHTLEQVPETMQSSPGLRLLHARVLAGTGATRLAQKELEAAREAGASAAACLEAAERLLAVDARNLELFLLRARLALAAGDAAIAAQSFAQVLSGDPSRAESLGEEIEAACSANPHEDLGRLLVDVFMQLERPREASEALQRLRTAGGARPEVLFELATTIAATYGFSAGLLLVFVDTALATGHEREARAAVAHYLASPGARVSEFTPLLAGLLHERAELAPALAAALAGLQLPVELRLPLALAGLEGDRAVEAAREIELVVLERPALRAPAIAALEAHLERGGDTPHGLLLAANLSAEAGRTAAAARFVARALRAAPSDTDRICRIAETVLRRDPMQPEAWNDVVLALLDVQRPMHARELCHLAAQILPAEDQGFVHAAEGEILLATGQLHAAVNAFETALACADAPFERIVARLQNAIDTDAKHGYAHYVLAMAVLRSKLDAEVAVAHLRTAIQLDDLLVDLGLDLLAEHADALAQQPSAHLLEGTLRLRKGERDTGISLLDAAVQRRPDLAPEAVPLLEAEWDRDAGSGALGFSFARALRAAGQGRRAVRLLGDVARRFPDLEAAAARELEAVTAHEPLPEAHRTLWEIHLGRGDGERARASLQGAAALLRQDESALRELLETALQRLPGDFWIACQLAELEAAAGGAARAEELLRAQLEAEGARWKGVLESARAALRHAPAIELRLLEIDALVAGGRLDEALEGVRRLRIEAPAARAGFIARARALVEAGARGPAELDLAVMLKEEGRVEEALAALEAAVARLPEPPGTDPGATDRELRLTLATLYVELGREPEGRELLASVLDRPGDHQEAYGILERLASRGMLSKLRNLRDTIARSPGNLRARLELARLSIVSMDFEGAREALSFSGDSAAVEAARRYLLARSHADEDQPQLALAVLRSIACDDVADDELRRNILYSRAVCCEHMGNYGEAHALFLQLLSEVPYFRDTRERARRTYQRYLETALETRAEVLEKRTHLDISRPGG